MIFRNICETRFFEPGPLFDWKRAFDLSAAAAAVVLLSPIMMVIALLIKFDSRGPILFRQRRVGLGSRPFTLLKFRTMIPAHNGRELTFADDRRITRLGRLLRRAKLDELPQLWNILAGEMSFVGPRPLVESTVLRFRDEYRWILARTRPGLTDLASIRYRHESALLAGCAEPEEFYHRVIMPEKIRLQKEYVRTQSLPGDLRILCLTLAACCRLHAEPASANQPKHPMQPDCAVQPKHTMLQPKRSVRRAALRPAIERAGALRPAAWSAETAAEIAEACDLYPPLVIPALAIDGTEVSVAAAILGAAVEAGGWQIEAR